MNDFMFIMIILIIQLFFLGFIIGRHRAYTNVIHKLEELIDNWKERKNEK